MVALIASMNTALAQCFTATNGLWPSTTFNPVCGGAFANVTTSGYASEYSNVNLVAGNTYVFKSSISTDYITVDNNGAAPLVGVVGVSGTAGVTLVCSVTGTYRFYTHTSASCGASTSLRTRSMSCGTAGGPATSCPATTSFGSGTANACAGTVQISTCNYGGEYATVSGIVAGGSYKFTSSVATDWITVRSLSTAGTVVSFAVQGTNWTAPSSGTYYFTISTNNSCGTASACRTTNIVTNANTAGCVVAVDPCASISNLSCGTAASYALAGVTGAWSSFVGPFTTPGSEKVFSFTPTLTGAHSIAVTASSGYVDLFYKSGSCGSTGWTYVDDIFGSASNNVNLTAGTTYYFLLDDEDVNATTGNITVTCPTPAPDPCVNITTIASCGGSDAFTIAAGDGLWSSFGGLFATPGQEMMYSFTPNVTASYPITVVNNGPSTWVDLFIKSASVGCNTTGWTYVDDVSGTVTNNVTLTAGTTYYILLDPESTTGAAGSISIGCPCIGPVGGIDAVYNGAFNVSSTTAGACDDNTLRAGFDRTYQFNVTCAGNYQISLCGSSFDTYLYLSTGVNSGVISFNDDFCTLQSQISANLSAGTYYVTVEGYSSTTTPGAFTLNVTGTDTPSGSASASNVSCNGGSNGSITVNATGGNGLTYSLNGGAAQSSNVFSGLAAGAYNVVVANCQNNSTTISASVSQPALLIASSSADAILCNGGTANVTVNYTGGTAPYSGIGVVANVGAGAYNYVVTDANGCSANTSITVTEPDLLVATASAPAIACNGGYTPISISATGGTGSYYGAGVDIDYLYAGDYYFYVNDDNGCEAEAFISITEPTALVVSNTTSDFNGFGVSCNAGSNGSVNVSATGGTAPYSGDGNNAGLIAGNYNYTVTDANGCSASTSATISEPTVLVASNTTSDFNGFGVSCNGGANGSVNVSAIGGVTPYSGNGNNAGLSAGNYNYTVTDANGCSASTSATISEPTVLVASTTTSNFNGYGVSCNGGSNGEANVSATGGVTPYIGDGNNANLSAGNYNYTVTDANGCTSNTSATITEPTVLVASSSAPAIICNGGTTIVNVSATGGVTAYSGDGNYTVGEGSYNYTVTDANGCSASTSIVLTQPVAIDVNITSTSISCNGGSSTVTVNASNGNAPYTGTGTFVQVAGDYSYVITDAIGCSVTQTYTINQPAVLVASSSTPTIACYDGNTTLTITATGGTGSYSYFIHEMEDDDDEDGDDDGDDDGDGDGDDDGDDDNEDGDEDGDDDEDGDNEDGDEDGDDDEDDDHHFINTTGLFTVDAGTYQITVVDVNGCSTTITVVVTEPASALSASVLSSAILCNGGTSNVVVTATGGTAPYNGTGTFIYTAGSYNFTVTDANGCSVVKSKTINQPAVLVVNAGLDAIVYTGYQNCKTLKATKTGGSGSVNYVWSNGVTNANNIVCPTTATSYTVTGTDANGCVSTDDVNVCAVNVVCYAGNSNVQKVEICHKGNTLCVSANAVAAHLAHGCTLGSCAEANACSNLSSRMVISESTSDEIVLSEIKLFPNPAKDNLQVSISNFDEMGTATFTIVNAIGQEVYTGTLNSNETSINISTLNSGVYYFKTNTQTAKPVIFVVQ